MPAGFSPACGFYDQENEAGEKMKEEMYQLMNQYAAMRTSQTGPAGREAQMFRKGKKKRKAREKKFIWYGKF